MKKRRAKTDYKIDLTPRYPVIIMDKDSIGLDPVFLSAHKSLSIVYAELYTRLGDYTGEISLDEIKPELFKELPDLQAHELINYNTIYKQDGTYVYIKLLKFAPTKEQYEQHIFGEKLLENSPSLDSMAKAMGMSLEDVVSAVDELKKHGLVKEDKDGGIYPISPESK